MRAAQDFPSAAARTRGRRVRFLLIAAVVLVVLVVALKTFATIYTDSLWFSSVSLHHIWSTLLGVKVGLFASFGATFFVLVWVNLAICDRLSTRHPAQGTEDELVRRYQRIIRPHAARLHTAVALFLALIGGVVAIGQWNNWLLFTHAQSFHQTDPQFGKDIGFFVFRLPFIEFLVDWSIGILFVLLIVTVAFHYFNGGIRTQRNVPRFAPQVKVHLSVILAVIAIAKAIGYYYQRFTLDVSTNGYVEGGGYTDVHARLPAMEVLFFISLASAVILLYNIRLQGWRLPVVAIALWAFVALVIGVIYPALLQWIHVGPAQSKLELTFIGRNIKATRTAYGLTSVSVTKHFEDSSTLSPTAVAAALTSLQNIRLWDPTSRVSKVTFNKQQDLAGYYAIPSVQPDRYTVNKKLVPVDIGVREVQATSLASPNWINTHLQYTHGNGVVMAQSNQTGADGSPNYVISNLPNTSKGGFPEVKQPAVYFGQTLPGYVIADTKVSEIDRATPAGGNKESHYAGTGGVKLGSIFTRAAFALRLGDFNLLISDLITSQSKIMFVRTIRAMAQKAAPFLSFDSQPYAAVITGHVDWILNGYTTTSEYPYAENASTLQVPTGSGLPTSYNYVRNSVEVVVNAYTGTMTFYDIDAKDPILNAYKAAFPTMFKSFTQMPVNLRAHLRYGQDIFAAQAAVYGRYHITKPSQFYSASTAWLVTPTLGVSEPKESLQVNYTVNSQGQVTGATYAPMTPLYQVVAEPGEPTQQFTVTDAYVPAGNGTKSLVLRSFLMGSSDPTSFGSLKVYETPAGTSRVGPVQADSYITATSTISSKLSLLNQNGSTALLGNTLMIPVGDSLVYVRPLYVESKSVPQPVLTDVIGVLGHKVVLEPTLNGMLDSLLGTSLGTTSGLQVTTSLPTKTTSTPTSSSASSAQVQQAKTDLLQASQDYTLAQTYLKQGKLGTYQSEVDKAAALTTAAQNLLAEPGTSTASGTTTTTTPTTTPPASSTTSTTAPSATSTTSTTTTTTTTSGET